jgi:Peptidase family M28
MPDSIKGSPRGGALALALFLYAFVLIMTAGRTRPPAAKPTDAPAGDFAAGRARKVLRNLVGDGTPHPVGSAANEIVRGRIVAELTRLGFQPRVTSGFACDDWGTCAEVTNVVALLDGQQSGPDVLLSAHYDSVPAGPGASDDGAGVAAVLEVARAMKVSPPPKHPVIFLIDDGEEAGLLGAEAFVASDPLAKDVRADVNLEARGTSGPSLMFETGNANGWLMRLYASTVRDPDTSSIDYQVYKWMPNDTDFTVFKRAGYQGFNFAFIGDVTHYHTPLDNFANSSPRSLQQQGDNALATVRALANSDLSPGPPTEAVFFDLFGWKTIWWPARWTIGFAGFAFFLLVLEIIVLLRKGRMSTKELLMGIASWPVTLAAGALAGGVLYFILLKMDALPVSWVAHPAPILTSACALGFAVAGFLGLTFWRCAGFSGLWCGVWLWSAIASLILAALFPALSYILVLPSMTAAIFGLLAAADLGEARGRWILATIAPGIVAGAVGFQAVWLLYDGLGGIALMGITPSVVLLATPLTPLFGAPTGSRRWRFPLFATSLVFIFGIAALKVSPYSQFAPERLNLAYLQGASKAEWMAYPASNRLPQPLRAAASFTAVKQPILPLEREGGFVADAPSLNLPPPQLSVLQTTPEPMRDRTEYRVRLRSPRGASEITLAFPPDSKVEKVFMESYAVRELRPQVLRYLNNWHAYTLLTLPAAGAEMRFTLPDAPPIRALLVDKSFTLPLEGLFLLKARPETAVPSQDGDATIVAQWVTLKPK